MSTEIEVSTAQIKLHPVGGGVVTFTAKVGCGEARPGIGVQWMDEPTGVLTKDQIAALREFLAEHFSECRTQHS
jgi:Tfp pilus assembly protein PilZ